MTGRIELRGLRLLGRHGAAPGEQDAAQPFQVDVDIETDLTAAGRSDALDDTVDYGAAVDAVVMVVGSESHHLLERLAVRIAEQVAALDPRVTGVTVTVAKLRPPVAADLASAAVRISWP